MQPQQDGQDPKNIRELTNTLEYIEQAASRATKPLKVTGERVIRPQEMSWIWQIG